MRRGGFLCFLLVYFLGLALAGTAFGQSYGVELHNTLMPAAGAMGGVSISRP